MKNDNFDFISSKFEEENIKAPEALNEENIKAKLEKGTSVNNIIKFKPNNKRFFKGALSIAAAIALVVVSLSVANYYNNRITLPDVPDAPKTDSVSGLKYFSSYDELDALMKERTPQEGKNSRLFGGYDYAVKSSDMAESVASNESTTGVSGASHSDTYKQVDAVDEADIVKTDGEYIYFVSEYSDHVVICSAKNGKTKKVSEIKLKKDNTAREMFIKDNTLVVIASKDEYNEKKDKYTVTTSVFTYNIKDRSNPKAEHSYSQSGSYNSSRMIGDCVYLVSNYSNYYYFKYDCIPCATNADGDYEIMSYNDICAIEDSDSSNYTVIGALDIRSGREAKKTKAVIGATDNIYCNENNLYITGINYNYYSYSYDSKCTLIKVKLNGTDIKIAATGEVRGNVNDQFSMDEKDGYFRIATTAQTQKGNDINILYVLDEDLNEVGRVKGFAKNEHIEAVKYIGDMAYVITYERTDPLFIINLSEPENPEILGEVKISGFSTMLIPIDDNTLLGIGYSTEENEFGEATNGLKLALFDISDNANPKVIGEKELKGVSSDVQYEHKALVVNKDKNYFAIPASFDDYEECGALVFNAENGKINIIKEFVSDELIEADRCIFIDDDIYVIDTYEEIIDSFEF